MKGHLVEVADGGREGVEKWESFSPDVVFLDVLMPDLNGPKVIEHVGETSAKVVLMSAYTGDYDLEKAQSLGANLFVSKPFDDILDLIKIAEGLVNE